MSNKIFHFGEKVKGFDIRVLNEREVRAGAGILFFFATASFSLALLRGNFYMTKIFVIIFLVDFFVRIVINPKFSPSLILGRFFVRNQKPEYVGAPQKRFAWSLGFLLALAMFGTIVVFNTFSPLNALICILCLLLLFFESAFGICLGCKMYNLFNKKDAELCPGGVCEVAKKEEIQKISILQVSIVAIVFVGIFILVNSGIVKKGDDLRRGSVSGQAIGACVLGGEDGKNQENKNEYELKYRDEAQSQVVDKTQDKDCEVPDWAVKIGHEEIWKEHHGCK